MTVSEFQKETSKKNGCASDRCIDSKPIGSSAKARTEDEYTKSHRPIWLVAFAIFINGLLGILQVLFTRFPLHPRLYGLLMPFRLFHLSRSLTLTLGFMLIYLSFRLLQRHRIAWGFAVVASAAGMVTHLGQQELWYTAFAPAAAFILLIIFHNRFTVKSEPRSISNGLLFIGLSVIIAVSYGTFGFWFLDKRDFGITFEFTDALIRTLREFSLIGNIDLSPITRHARWFIDSLHMMGIVAAVFGAYSLFRPVAYRYAALPHERALAGRIVEQSARSSYDFFKTWPDKAYFFSDTQRSFVAYKTLSGVAVSLGDAVGPEDEIATLTRSFLRFCSDKGWIATFLLPDLIPMYRELGLSVLKIGEGAVVDLEYFSSHTAKKKYFRYIKRKFEGDGYSLHRYEPPHPRTILDETSVVSNEWLTLPRHREFGFIEGKFAYWYLEKTPLFILRDKDGRMLAFANQIPSYRPGEATIDLMRHRPGVHWGVMDYLFRGMMLILRETEYRTFYLGLAGIGSKPGTSMVENAIYQISEHFNWLVHSKGVRQFKSKFEPTWEDRYLVYRGIPVSLAKIALAIRKVL